MARSTQTLKVYVGFRPARTENWRAHPKFVNPDGLRIQLTERRTHGSTTTSQVVVNEVTVGTLTETCAEDGFDVSFEGTGRSMITVTKIEAAQSVLT